MERLVGRKGDRRYETTTDVCQPWIMVNPSVSQQLQDGENHKLPPPLQAF
jgi:hypothetical protein